MAGRFRGRVSAGCGCGCGCGQCRRSLVARRVGGPGVGDAARRRRGAAAPTSRRPSGTTARSGGGYADGWSRAARRGVPGCSPAAVAAMRTGGRVRRGGACRGCSRPERWRLCGRRGRARRGSVLARGGGYAGGWPRAARRGVSGVSARSGWRVRAGTSAADRFRAVPGRTPRRGPTHDETSRATRTPHPPRTGRRRHLASGRGLSTAGAEPGSGRPADSDMNHTATPPITAAAIM